MLSRTQIPYEKVATIPVALKLPLDQIPQNTTNEVVGFCIKRVGGLPQGLKYDPPVFTRHEEGYAIRVRFHGLAETYVDDNKRVLASMTTMFDGFVIVFSQQNRGMIVG